MMKRIRARWGKGTWAKSKESLVNVKEAAMEQQGMVCGIFQWRDSSQSLVKYENMYEGIKCSRVLAVTYTFAKDHPRSIHICWLSSRWSIIQRYMRLSGCETKATMKQDLSHLLPSFSSPHKIHTHAHTHTEHIYARVVSLAFVSSRQIRLPVPT